MNISHCNVGMGIKMSFRDRFFSCCTSFSPVGPKDTLPPSASYSPAVNHHFLSLFGLSSPSVTSFLQLGYKIDSDVLERILPHLGYYFTAAMLTARSTSPSLDGFARGACSF